MDGDLHISEDIDFQEREWTAERIGWFCLLALLVVAAVGVFGHGPVSWTSATTPDGSLEVTYERFGRRGGDHTVRVRADASVATGGTWALEVSNGYLADVEVRAISPEPDAAESVPGAVRYTFTQAEPGADLEVSLSIRPTGLWRSSGEIGVAGHGIVTLRQFLFP